jgi:hypothetical protein
MEDGMASSLESITQHTSSIAERKESTLPTKKALLILSYKKTKASERKDKKGIIDARSKLERKDIFSSFIIIIIIIQFFL